MTDVSSTSSTTVRRSRNWCFTLHTDDNKFDISSLFKQPPGQFMVAQLEIAPSTQKLHIQGYIQFNATKTLNQVRTYFDTYKPHVEIAKGDAKSNIAYCTKDETRAPNTEFVLLGEIPKRAAKSVKKPGENKQSDPFQLALYKEINDPKPYCCEKCSLLIPGYSPSMKDLSKYFDFLKSCSMSSKFCFHQGKDGHVGGY